MDGVNANSRMIAPIENYTSFIWTERYSAAGDFQLDVPASMEALDLYREGRWLYQPGTGCGMIIEKAVLTTDIEDGDNLKITGFSFESLLERRIIWQQQNVNGNLQNALFNLVTRNASATATISQRRLPVLTHNVVSQDPRITTLNLEAQYTGTNLYEVITNVCDAHDIGFRMHMSTPSIFTVGFELYAGQDRSHTQTTNPFITFSPAFDNLIRSEYEEDIRPFRTVALVGGEGEGSARTYYATGPAGYAGMSRRELFVDARDLSRDTDTGTLDEGQYEDALIQRGNEKLAETKRVKKFTGEVETTQLYRYGEHFFMGDILQMANQYGQGARVRVTEYTKTSDNTGDKGYPTFEVL